MKKIVLTLALIAAIGAVKAQRYSRDDIRRYDERGVYTDDRGDYHWQVIERRVWIPTHSVRGLFGSRTIPGHYEMRTERVKVYHYRQGRRPQHPHGMPPGQRKKMNDGRYYERDRDYNYPYDDNRNWNDRRYDNSRD